MKSILLNNAANNFQRFGNSSSLRYTIISLLLSFSLLQVVQAQQEFDLALAIYPTQDEPVLPGQTANFTIEVFNQGDIPASNIKIVDYIPDGLEFTTTGNTGWSSIGNRAITTITNVVMPGESEIIFLNLVLKSNANPSNVENFAEIALSQDDAGNDTTLDDIDSNADSNENNDAGAFAFTSTDDYIDGTGILDEDDHDVALLIICTQNACNDQVNISLNAVCNIEIVADMIVENPDYPDGAYTILLEDEDGNILPSNMVDGSFVGETLKVSAFIEGCPAGLCWGYATIEDKFAIELFCEIDTVDCGEETPDLVGLPLESGVSYYASGDNYIVPGMNGCSDITLSYEDNIEMLPCQTGSPFVARIYRDWLAEDGVGNQNSCTSEIYIRKGYLSDVVAPSDYINNPLACGEYPQLPNGNPDPIFTGFPEGTSCPNLIAVYEDLEVPSGQCPGIFDVVREWTVVDWCNSQDTTFQQVIKIMDNEAPSCSSPSKFYASADSDKCEGDVEVVNPTLVDNCSNTSFTIGYKIRTNNNNNYNDLIYDNITGTSSNYTIHDLPVGEYRIAYFAEDDCGNQSQCLGVFEVRDEQEPTPICIIETSVTLDGSGNASITAESLDAGSIDNCAVDYFRVRRMEADCGFGNTNFKSSTNFCCEDAGKTVMVVFRVYDEAGNFNDCMVAVYVIDDQIPTILCPSDLTFTCSQYDQFNEELPTYLTGEPFANDNCDLDIEYFDTKAFNECGVGIVVRNWTAVDNAGNLATCKQYIEIESDFQFDSNMIVWPDDTSVNQCVDDEIDPSATGLPILPSETCSSFSIDYDDNVISQTGAGCGFVERTFTITDNCALDPNNNSFSYVQIIEIFENEDPVFNVCEDITVLADNNNCTADFSYSATATDNCTSESQLIYSYTVDYYNDGSIDESGNGKNLNGNYPSGTHRAVFYSEDQCENLGSCAFLFTIQDSKNPTPICLPVSVTLDETGVVEIWASDFNHKSFDNCTNEENLVFSFSPDIDDVVRVFDCNDLPNGVSGVVSIQMYVWDEAGNFDYCTVTLTITDSQNVCPDSGTITAEISGKIMNMEGEKFSDVEVYIEGEQMSTNMKISDDSGNYIFDALSLYDNYTVTPSKNDDALNGITTLDIVKIQKHILGLEMFSDMQQIIAADVNKSSSISGADIIQLRRLILGLYEDDILPDNESWRFIPADFEWNEAFPYEFPETTELSNLLQNEDSLFFYGIKTGDVNNSALTNLNEEIAETRKNPEHVKIESQDLISGEYMSIPVLIQNDKNLVGFQLAIDFDQTIMELVGVSSSLFEEQDDNVNIKEGTVYISWNELDGQAVEQGDVLFTLNIRSKINGELEESDLNLNSDFVSELFEDDLDVRKIDIQFVDERSVKKVNQIVQNYPNPFIDQTTISFELKEAGAVNYQIYSMDGMLLKNDSIEMKKGNNSIEILSETIVNSGIYYVKIEAEQWESTVKIIKLE